MKQHTTVLLREAVEALALSTSSTVVDATLGAGGHTRAITQYLNEQGTFIGIDADRAALEAVDLEGSEATIHLVNQNFSHIREILSSLNINEANAILADLGWRMEQFAGNGKGFSFQVDEPLLMTFGDSSKYSFTARDIVNEWEEETLANIFYGYAEERFARRIARKIVEVRQATPIDTTFQLVAAVEAGLPAAIRHRHSRVHPATKVFQALRIAVNDELTVLETFITDSFSLLAPGGRLAIISFHSIEDRIVKHRFRELASADAGSLITKKPIIPGAEEVTINPRARSAKLRIIEKHTT